MRKINKKRSVWTNKISKVVIATLFFTAAIFQIQGKANAGIKDVPGQIKISTAQSFNKAAYHPGLFGTNEKRSTQLKAFTKWSTMFKRFERQIKSPSSSATVQALQSDLRALQGLPLATMTKRVNAMMNETRYITDKKNWGKSDYWATPVEFLERGGDCEDFAIAKYTALRILGVPENRLRLAIVHDKVKNIPHAVLIVYTDEEGPLVLDNQRKTVWNNQAASQRYRAIFSINRTAWWLHTKPTVTRVASAK